MSARATGSCAGHRTRGHCAFSAMLTVSQLSKSFAGRALFDDVSLQVNRGDRIGLVGPNGAGKSTLFALLLGDVSPDNGTSAIMSTRVMTRRITMRSMFLTSTAGGSSNQKRNGSSPDWLFAKLISIAR